MSMCTWKRKVAHAQVERLGIKHANKERINPITGRKAPSWFAVNWRHVGIVDIPKPRKRKRRNGPVSE